MKRALPFFLATLSGVPSLSAAALPTPVFTSADPQMVYPGTFGFLDRNGRIAVYLRGMNLSPDSDLGHPSGWPGGYQHIFVRRVSPSNAAGPWTRCESENGCIAYGGAAQSVLSLGLDPARFLGERGSHMQVRMWVSMGASNADTPERAESLASDWSNIWTVDAAAPGATKPAPAPSLPPNLTKVVPGEYQIGDKSPNYRLRIYGNRLCGENKKVVFNGDIAGAVTPEESHCKGVDDDGGFLPAGLALIHVTLPTAHRPAKPGNVSVVVQDASGSSNSLSIAFKAIPIVKGGIGPHIETPAALSPTQNPGVATPPPAAITPTPSAGGLVVPVQKFIPPKPRAPGNVPGSQQANPY